MQRGEFGASAGWSWDHPWKFGLRSVHYQEKGLDQPVMLTFTPPGAIAGSIQHQSGKLQAGIVRNIESRMSRFHYPTRVLHQELEGLPQNQARCGDLRPFFIDGRSAAIRSSNPVKVISTSPDRRL